MDLMARKYWAQAREILLCSNLENIGFALEQNIETEHFTKLKAETEAELAALRKDYAAVLSF